MKFCLEVWAQYLLPWSRNLSSLSLCGFILRTVCIAQIYCRKQRNGAANWLFSLNWCKMGNHICLLRASCFHGDSRALAVVKPWTEAMEVYRRKMFAKSAICSLSVSVICPSTSLFILSFLFLLLIICFYLLLCISNHPPVIYYNVSSVLYR